MTTTTIASKNPVWAGSTLATLHGGKDADSAGLIYQKDNNPISVVNYSGHTNIFYEHDANDPTKIIGGSLILPMQQKALLSPLSQIIKVLPLALQMAIPLMLRIIVANVLNNLAGKLFYKNYTDGHLPA